MNNHELRALPVELADRIRDEDAENDEIYRRLDAALLQVPGLQRIAFN